jgi:signal transduction histidine kinase
VEIGTGSLNEPITRLHEERQPGVTASLRELHLACDPDMPAARFDERRLREVVDALVDNAVKFTPEGSQILVRVGKTTYEGKTWASVTVEDNGPGITKDAVGALFEPFSQADGSTTRAAGGMGLGLAVARQLVQSMGGDLVVSTVLGQGTIFSVLLPLAEIVPPSRGEDGDVRPLENRAA